MKGYLLLLAVLCTAMLGSNLALLSDDAKVDVEQVRWRSDLAAGLGEAKAAGKDVLVAFLAQDQGHAPLLGGSATVDQQIAQSAAAKFIPVRLMVSTDSETAAEASAGVVALAERLSIPRIPCLVLMDSAGRPYATIEANDPKTAEMCRDIDLAGRERIERDRALALASAASGAAKARHLHEAMQHVGPFAVTAYESTVAEIVALDPDDALKLRGKYIEQLSGQRIDRLIQAKVYPLIDRANFSGAIAAIDAIISAEKPPKLQIQKLTGFKGQLYQSMGEPDKARQVLREALAMAPTSQSAQQINRALERLDE